MEKKINILHVTLFMGTGGLETVVVDLCKYIDSSKFNIQILCMKDWDPLYKTKLFREGISVQLIKRKNRFDISYFRKIVVFIKKQKPDIIHLHSGCLFNGVLCAKLAGVPKIIYTVQGMNLFTDMKSRFEDNIANIFVHKIIPVSEEIKQELQTWMPLSRKKLQIIFNSINTDIFHDNHCAREMKRIKESLNISNRKLIIGSVGRLEKIKNYELLIRSFGLLFKKVKNTVHLVFIGDGSERANLERLTRELNLENHVSFLGRRYDIEKLLPMFDIFVLSSFTEGTSLSLLEAQACGIPAVATNVGGNNGIICDGFNGFLCQDNDINDLCDKLSVLMDDNSRYHKMKKNARKRVVDKFSLSSMIETYEKIYENMFEISNAAA